ncbi:MAG TPA: hypothetical protein VI299_24395 [Polyangiales bacterium]
MKRLYGSALLALASLASSQVRAQDAAPPAPKETPAEPQSGPATEPAPTPSGAALPAAVLEPTPADVAAPSADIPPELSLQDLAALGLSDPTSAVDKSLKIYGYMDFALSAQKNPKGSIFSTQGGANTTFYVGSINLYMSKQITEAVRTLLEVRFTYLPNGASAPEGALSGAKIGTSVDDYVYAGGQQRWGGIILQRAYLDWTVHPALVLRAGQYLTPYGIWNVDHGSPTIIPVLRPYVMTLQLFPERQTGLQAFGRYALSTHNAVNYAVTVSNGFGPISEYRDLDSNKAVGGHINWTNDGLGEFRIGGSWFYGRDTSATQPLTFKPDGSIGSRTKISQQSDVLSLAADLRWMWSGLLVQGEVLTQQRRFTSQGSVGAPNALAGNQVLAPKDALSWGTYALVGYRFRWLGVMPYVIQTYNYRYDASAYTFGESSAVAGGLNIRPVDSVVLKLEYGNLRLLGKNRPTDDVTHFFQAQLAWAF